ncbi:hypothetical protein DDZ15_15135 [Rhodohalobacter mucosus]|uniref:Uncharacterized protein n=1 Tax=Rhodohalobacter mucosus TaxID=2079485 RepID=A0A316TNP1_9BACT|nr:hypothetical protein DDZ15_15135 [Rhodohalobacter mucosus]
MTFPRRQGGTGFLTPEVLNINSPVRSAGWECAATTTPRTDVNQRPGPAEGFVGMVDRVRPAGRYVMDEG